MSKERNQTVEPQMLTGKTINEGIFSCSIGSSWLPEVNPRVGSKSEPLSSVQQAGVWKLQSLQAWFEPALVSLTKFIPNGSPSSPCSSTSESKFTQSSPPFLNGTED